MSSSLPGCPRVAVVPARALGDRGRGVAALVRRLRGMLAAEGIELVEPDATPWLTLTWGGEWRDPAHVPVGATDETLALLREAEARLALAAAWGDSAPALDTLSRATALLSAASRAHIHAIPPIFGVDLSALRARFYRRAVIALPALLAGQKHLRGRWASLVEGAVQVALHVVHRPGVAMDRDDQAVALAAAELLRAESWTSHPDGVRCRGRLARRLGGLLNSRGATTPAWLYDTEEATELLEQVAAAGRRDVGSGEVVDLLAVATLDEPIRFMQTCDHGLWAVCVSPPIAAFVGGVTRGQISSAPAESEG